MSCEDWPSMEQHLGCGIAIRRCSKAMVEPHRVNDSNNVLGFGRLEAPRLSLYRCSGKYIRHQSQEVI
jgi:hypothetical protein